MGADKKPFRMQYGLHFERVFLDHITISGGEELLDIPLIVQLCCEIQQNNYCDYADYQRSQHTALFVEVRTVEAVGHII